MFVNEKKLIILFGKEKIKPSLVSMGKNPADREGEELSWTDETLSEVFENLKDKYKVDVVRVILSEEVNHVLKLGIPKDVENERSFIGIKIAEKVPEILENEDWDFQETGQTKNEKLVKVFAPAKEILQKITLASGGIGLKIEAIEPSFVSTKRNPNPFIGMAIKTDIKEKENLVPNMIPEAVDLRQIKVEGKAEVVPEVEEVVVEKPIQKAEPIIYEEEKKFNAKTFALLVFLFFLVGAVVSGGIIVYKKSMSLNSSAVKGVDVTPSPSPSIAPTSTPVLIDKENLKISILNGGGVAGAGKIAKDYLESLGYKNIKPGNAENFNYKLTGISVKKNKEESVDQLKKDLSSKYEISEQVLSLDESSEFDIIIIIGKK